MWRARARAAARDTCCAVCRGGLCIRGLGPWQRAHGSSQGTAALWGKRMLTPPPNRQVQCRECPVCRLWRIPRPPNRRRGGGALGPPRGRLVKFDCVRAKEWAKKFSLGGCVLPKIPPTPLLNEGCLGRRDGPAVACASRPVPFSACESGRHRSAPRTCPAPSYYCASLPVRVAALCRRSYLCPSPHKTRGVRGGPPGPDPQGAGVRGCRLRGARAPGHVCAASSMGPDARAALQATMPLRFKTRGHVLQHGVHPGTNMGRGGFSSPPLFPDTKHAHILK